MVREKKFRDFQQIVYDEQAKFRSKKVKEKERKENQQIDDSTWDRSIGCIGGRPHFNVYGRKAHPRNCAEGAKVYAAIMYSIGEKDGN